jgi:hypothetical protein
VTACRRGEQGQAGGVETLAFGVLVFVVGALVVANAWAVIDAKLAVASAAREATRAYAEAPATLTPDEALAASHAAADAAFKGHRDSTRGPELRLVAGEGASRERCARVTAEVSVRVPTVTLPWVGRFGRGFRVVARHSEIVDPFRSGLSGTASCADGGSRP